MLRVEGFGSRAWRLEVYAAVAIRYPDMEVMSLDVAEPMWEERVALETLTLNPKPQTSDVQELADAVVPTGVRARRLKLSPRIKRTTICTAALLVCW